MPTSNYLTPSWKGRHIGITGASGALGKALTRCFQSKGAKVIGLTHTKPQSNCPNGPDKWIQWQCGEENKLESCLNDIDILIINHGINSKGLQSTKMIDKSLEINALSSWRLIKLFERLCSYKQIGKPRELWINTSEAEIQAALSPVYEISKRLIGQIVSLRDATRTDEDRKRLIMRKLILGPFRSNLNPIGIMSANFVAEQILFQASIGICLIIVSPNPFTYLLMPLIEFARRIYSKILNHSDQ